MHPPPPSVVTVDPRALGRGPQIVDVYELLATRYRWAHSVVLGADDDGEVLVGEVVPDPPR